MQDKNPRTNQARTDATRAALIKAARALFAEKGYANTGTPEIVGKAKVTRGALYHHFADKADLFRAVVRAEAAHVASDIAASNNPADNPVQALASGANAYFAAMQDPGRVRLLLIDGPAVLGLAEMTAIDRATGAAQLQEGLEALPGTSIPPDELAALSVLLSAAFDCAALAVANGEKLTPYRRALVRLMSGLA